MAASPRSSARWTWDKGCSSPSAKSWRKNSTCRFRSRVKVFMGDHTATSVNQGGASGSTGIQLGGKQMRVGVSRSAPCAGRHGGRKAWASCGPADGDRRRRACEDRRCEKSQLRRPDRRPLFQRPARLEQGIRQCALCARQGRSPRTRAKHKIVGQPIKREDIAPKVFAQQDCVNRHQGGRACCMAA